MHDPTVRKLLSMLAHGSIFFSATFVAIAVPVALLMASEDPVVRDNAREALNFHFTIWLAGVVSALLIFVLVGFLLLPLVVFISVILPIIAMIGVAAEPDQAYSYPVAIRLL